MAQVQDSTIPGRPSPDTAIPVWPVSEIESVPTEETRQPSEAAPVTHDSARSEMPSPGRTPSPLWLRTSGLTRSVKMAAPVDMPDSERSETRSPERRASPLRLSTASPVTLTGSDDESEEWFSRISEDKGIDMDYRKYNKLRSAAVDDDWYFVKKFIENDPEALTAKLSDSGQTILHYMVNSKNIIEFVHELVEKKMKPEDLERADKKGLTVLSVCAIVGNKKAAKIIVGKNPKLLNIPDKYKNLPLHYAAKFGHEDMVKFLLSKEEEDRGPQKEKDVPDAKLFENLITSDLYGIALELLQGHKNLDREHLKHRKRVLKALAQKPLGFESGSQFGFLKRLIYKCIPDSSLPYIRGGGDVEDNPDSSFHDNRGSGDVEDPKTTSDSFPQQTSPTRGAMCKTLYVMLYYIIKQLVPGIQSIHDTKLKHKQTCELVKLICEGWTLKSGEASDLLKEPLLIAARLGIQEIVDEIIKVHPPSVGFRDADGHNVFQLAVLHRQEKVFSLIYKMGVGIDWVANFRDKKGNNNILHLAGKLVPSSRVAGAALQMQRELQWYKVVENRFHSSLQEQKNSDKLTPREMFTKEHTDLVKAGQEWIKDAATSCSVVAALIITVAFAAAITVPGGNDSQGRPNYLNEKSFLVFAISNAMALFFSTNSVLMFLGILTSRYSEEDFLVSLPRKMIIGLITLLVSIATMMIAFVATLHLLVFDPLRWVIFPVIILACLPVVLFVFLQFPLLIEMIGSTYGPSFIQRPKDSFAAKRKSRMRKILKRCFHLLMGPASFNNRRLQQE